MSSTNDALSLLVGLANARAAAASGSSQEQRVDDRETARHDASSANIVFFDDINDESVQMTPDEINRQRQMQRELGKLQFINPGGSMSQPIKGRRSRRKIIEDKEVVQEKRIIFHDKKGKLIVPGEDCITLCDCLIPECHGCHWPCENCGGRLCGPICQQNRKKFVSSVKVLGVTPEVVTNNPFVSNKYS
ncbi:unnamed protein product [Cylicocyclus nassatus]|uniref:ARF7 effector protein C-terminal domain-containing protein n=1 Tax=Cylicocyclus nassatus TaxID=53992 RepID=A0AA36MA55_CYLNA|nr:unnamed protein product [Cylicocyclus nassatus]